MWGNTNKETLRWIPILFMVQMLFLLTQAHHALFCDKHKSYYCDKHALCVLSPHSTCAGETKMTSDIRTLVAYIHNDCRDSHEHRQYEEDVDPLVTSANMMLLDWDVELEMVAQRLVNSCDVLENSRGYCTDLYWQGCSKCSVTAPGKALVCAARFKTTYFVNINVSIGDEVQIIYAWHHFITSVCDWGFNNYRRDLFESYKSNDSIDSGSLDVFGGLYSPSYEDELPPKERDLAAAFSAMMAARTTRLGCAHNMGQDGDTLYVALSCVYGPGRREAYPLQIGGRPASRCPFGTRSMTFWSRLCRVVPDYTVPLGCMAFMVGLFIVACCIG